jgi:adenine-specific DNA methylase
VKGYELSKLSAKICSILYPNASISSDYFESLFISKNDSIKGKINGLKKYSLIIGNPPYGKFDSFAAGMGEKEYTKASNYIDYFITRGLDLLEKDGLLIYIIGTEVAIGGDPFLQKPNSEFKKIIAQKADLIDAYRLPNGLFEATDALTDIVVFKKK